MNLTELHKQIEDKMGKSLKAFEKDLRLIRTGRANPNILEEIRIDYYGSPTSILQVANVSVTDPQMITVSPWEKSMLTPIEKAIQVSDIGITPQNDGNLIRLPIPPLNQERRQELVKSAKKASEEIKIGLRNIRREGMTELKKMETDKLISQDDHKKEADLIEKKTTDYMGKINQMLAQKEKQLMED